MTCTCAGVAPGYPQHEPHCGKPETPKPAESDVVCECGHNLQRHDNCPCVHGCEERPCADPRCDCTEFTEDRFDLAQERIDGIEARGW